jgi:hypothetical protein
MTKLEAIKHDRIRQLILEALGVGYPNLLDTVVLRRHMANFGYPLSHGELMSYCAYLEEKELVEIKERPGGIVMIKARAKGLDVLDKRIPECGCGQDL